MSPSKLDKSLNPFAADEDDEEDGDFAIGDLEVEDEGNGNYAQAMTFNDLDKNVSIPC